MPTTTALDANTLIIQMAQAAQGETGGQVTLVAGVGTVAASWITANARPMLQLVTPNVVTLTTEYRILAITAGTGFTVQAIVAAGTINVADLSVLNWFVPNYLQ